MDKLKKRIIDFLRWLKVKTIRKVSHFTRRIHPPGFEGVSLWEILFFFFYSIRRGFIGTRASALSFHFFLAMIPFGLILVVMSNNLQFFDLENDIIPILATFIPEDLYNNFIENIHNFEDSTVNSILSVGFLLAIYFTSNGFSVMIRAFNHSKMKFQKRKWLSNRITSFLLVCAFTLGVIFLFLLIMYERKFFGYLAGEFDFMADYQRVFFLTSAYISVGLSLYLGIALLYYFGPSERKGFRFLSAGATFATIAIVVISEGYTLYIKYMAHFDELYGSIGVIMILMLWIYLMSFALLLGFELNTSIRGAIHKRRLENFKEMEQRYDETYI